MLKPRPYDALLTLKPHDARYARRLRFVLGIAWVLSVALAFALGIRHAAPNFDQALSTVATQAAEIKDLRHELDGTKTRLAVVERADQVSRAANTDLESTLKDREDEIASLRSDLAFYQRLVGGSAPREGLAVHSLGLKPIGKSGGYSFRLTLMQNLKKGDRIDGNVDLSVDGVRSNKLVTLDWSELVQNDGAKSLAFGFKYFQQLEGNLMLPPGFEPSKVKVLAKASDGQAISKEFAWAEAINVGRKDDVR